MNGQELDNRCDHPDHEDNGSYRVTAVCANCDWRGSLVLTKGHVKPRIGRLRNFPVIRGDVEAPPRCPRCECKAVQGEDYIAPVPEPAAA